MNTPLPRVIALDLSLTATGIADNASGVITTSTITSTPHGKDFPAKHQRLKELIGDIAGVTELDDPPTVIVMEGPSYGSKGNAVWDCAALWWLTYDDLTSLDGPPIVVVPPSVLKKYATGRGNADKADMRVELVERGRINIRDNNQVDAWWLCAFVLDRLGHPPLKMPAAHRAALDAVDWPTGVIAA